MAEPHAHGPQQAPTGEIGLPLPVPAPTPGSSAAAATKQTPSSAPGRPAGSLPGPGRRRKKASASSAASAASESGSQPTAARCQAPAQPDEEISSYDGCSVQQLFYSKKTRKPELYTGTARYVGKHGNTQYFKVRYSDNDSQIVTLAMLKTLLEETIEVPPVGALPAAASQGHLAMQQQPARPPQRPPPPPPLPASHQPAATQQAMVALPYAQAYSAMQQPATAPSYQHGSGALQQPAPLPSYSLAHSTEAWTPPTGGMQQQQQLYQTAHNTAPLVERGPIQQQQVLASMPPHTHTMQNSWYYAGNEMSPFPQPPQTSEWPMEQGRQTAGPGAYLGYSQTPVYTAGPQLAAVRGPSQTAGSPSSLQAPIQPAAGTGQAPMPAPEPSLYNRQALVDVSSSNGHLVPTGQGMSMSRVPVSQAEGGQGIGSFLHRLNDTLSSLNSQLQATPSQQAAGTQPQLMPSAAMNNAGSFHSFAQNHLKYIVACADTNTLPMSMYFARRFHAWESSRAGSVSAPPPRAAQVAGSQTSVFDLPPSAEEFKIFVKSYTWMGKLIAQYAMRRFPGEPAKRAQLEGTSLLRIDGSVVSQAFNDWVMEENMSPQSLRGRLSAQRKMFYNMGRCFAAAAPDIVLPDISCSYSPTNPVPLSLQQTLRMQLNMKRKADGSPSTPATERKNSKVPSAALLCTELASLYQKHSAMVKSAILHGTKRLELANIARLRAILAACIISAGRTTDTIFLSYSSAWVCMDRVIVGQDGLPRIVPVRMPVAVLALAGALNVFLGQEGLTVCFQVYQSKKRHEYVVKRINAKPPGGFYLDVGFLLGQSFMDMLINAPEYLDPASNPYAAILKTNAGAGSTDLRQLKRRYVSRVSELWKTWSWTRTELEKSSSSSDGASSSGTDAGSSDAERAAVASAVQGSKAGASSTTPAAPVPELGRAVRRKHTTLRGCRYAFCLESLMLGADAADTAAYVGHGSLNSQKAYQQNSLRSAAQEGESHANALRRAEAVLGQAGVSKLFKFYDATATWLQVYEEPPDLTKGLAPQVLAKAQAEFQAVSQCVSTCLQGARMGYAMRGSTGPLMELAGVYPECLAGAFCVSGHTDTGVDLGGRHDAYVFQALAAQAALLGPTSLTAKHKVAKRSAIQHVLELALCNLHKPFNFVSVPAAGAPGMAPAADATAPAQQPNALSG